MGGACSKYGDEVYRGLVGQLEGKGPLGRPRRRWRIILRCIYKKWDAGMDWIDLARNRDK
jgi:hypothetical protein